MSFAATPRSCVFLISCNGKSSFSLLVFCVHPSTELWSRRGFISYNELFSALHNLLSLLLFPFFRYYYFLFVVINIIFRRDVENAVVIIFNSNHSIILFLRLICQEVSRIICLFAYMIVHWHIVNLRRITFKNSASKALRFWRENYTRENRTLDFNGLYSGFFFSSLFSHFLFLFFPSLSSFPCSLSLSPLILFYLLSFPFVVSQSFHCSSYLFILFLPALFFFFSSLYFPFLSPFSSLFCPFFPHLSPFPPYISLTFLPSFPSSLHLFFISPIFPQFSQSSPSPSPFSLISSSSILPFPFLSLEAQVLFKAYPAISSSKHVEQNETRKSVREDT